MKELVDALVKAQSEMTHGLATGTNPHFKSEYAPLDEVIKAVKKPLNDNGIFFLQKVYLPHNLFLMNHQILIWMLLIYVEHG